MLYINLCVTTTRSSMLNREMFFQRKIKSSTASTAKIFNDVNVTFNPKLLNVGDLFSNKISTEKLNNNFMFNFFFKFYDFS